jgi:hypothetical protein
MDTNYFNSHTDLGINTNEGNRIDTRRLSTCAVLDLYNFTSTGDPTTSNASIEAYQSLDIGPNNNESFTLRIPIIPFDDGFGYQARLV